MEDGKFCRTVISAPKKYVFGTECIPMCPFATQIAASYIMTFRRRPDPDQFGTRKKAHVEIIGKTYFKK